MDNKLIDKPTSSPSDGRSRDPTYHTTSADYSLPNDAVEYARLSDQAEGITQMMHGTPIHARLSFPRLLLDIGCGTGIITRHLGLTYPDAKVYGVDLSPVPSDPEKAPANVEYILGDVRELLKSSDARLARGRADFVFSRLLIAGMADWRGYVRDMASLLRPGVGWLEIQDLALDWYLDGSLVSDSWEWLRALFCAAENKGWDLRCGRNAKGYMEEAGLVDVEVKEYRLPMGDWLVKTQPETRKIGENAAREYGMLYWHAIPRILKGMGYHEERIQEFRRQSVNDLRGREGLELRFYVTFGRKA